MQFLCIEIRSWNSFFDSQKNLHSYLKRWRTFNIHYHSWSISLKHSHTSRVIQLVSWRVVMSWVWREKREFSLFLGEIVICHPKGEFVYYPLDKTSYFVILLLSWRSYTGLVPWFFLLTFEWVFPIKNIMSYAFLLSLFLLILF